MSLNWRKKPIWPFEYVSQELSEALGDALILLTRLHVVSHSDSAISLTGRCSCYHHDEVNISSVLIFLSCFFFSGLSTAKRKFAESLNEFKFQCIGDAETDDEICIGE